MDNEERHQHSPDAERMFGRALWIRDNLPITPDEWGLLCLLIFGGVPEKRPTPEEFARARAHYVSPGALTAFPVEGRSEWSPVPARTLSSGVEEVGHGPAPPGSPAWAAIEDGL